MPSLITHRKGPDGHIFSNTQHVPNEYIDGSGQQTYYAYNTRGQLTTLTDANGSIWTRSYNNDGFLTQIDGPLAGNADVTTFAYDGYNRLYSVTDSEGYTKIFSYDNADRITQVTYPDSTTEVTIYNKLDAVMRKDRINRWTQDSYDSMDQLAFEIDPLGRKTEYSWCACGSMSSLTDGNGNTTTFNHDQNGRLVTKTYVDTTTLNYTYDSLGRLSTRVDALGQNTTYSYNLDNTLSGIVYYYPLNPTSNVTYTWDPNYMRLSTVANGWGTYTYNYNAYITSPTAPPITGGGMLATVLNSTIPNATTSYFYDALGRTTNRQINGTSNSVTWGYDQMSRVTSEANALGTFAYHYVDDVSGASKGTPRLASINYPNGQITNFSWYGTSQDERLQGITNLDPTGKTRSQFNYGYDSAGEIVSWPQQNAGMSPVNYSLGYDPAGQLVSAQGSTNTASPAANISNYSYDSAANRTAVQTSNIQTARISGTITAGNTVTITVSDTGLSGGQEVVTYTVVSGDTTATIATKLAAAISSDASLQTLGVNASAASGLIKIRSVSPNITTYAASTSVGATEVVTLNVSGNQIQNAVIGTLGAGYQTRANDVLTLKVFDAGLTGGVESVTYTIPSDNTSLPTAASGLAAAVNADTHLSTLGVTATAASSVLSIKSSSVNLTTYAASVTPTVTSATETIAVGANPVGNTTATIGGTVTTGDVVTLTAQSKSLTGSTETVQYKVPSGATTTTIATGLAAAINADTKFVSYGLAATSSGAVITISSSPTYSKSTSGGATETVTLGTNVNGNSSVTIGGTVTAGNTVTVKVSGAGLAAARSETYTVLSGDTLSTIASGLSAVINADATVKTLGVSALAASSVINISYNPINYALYRASVTGGATETITLLMNSNVNQIGVVAGTITAGDVVSITTTDFGLTGGTETTSYTVASGNTLTNVASGLTSAINADTNLQAIGVSATSSGTAITLSSSSPNITKFGSFGNSAATEAVTIGTNLNGVQTAIIGGTKTTGNVLSLTVFDAGLSAGKETVSYTVVAADTLTTIATALTNAINADTNLQAIGVSATSSSAVVNIKSASTNATTYLQSVSSGATETLALATGTGVSQYRNNELNQLINVSPGGQINLQAITNKPVKSASVNGQVVSIASTPPVSPFLATYSLSTNNPDFGGQFNLSNFLRGSAQFNVTGFNSGPSTVGTLYSVTVSHPALPNGQKTVTYTTVLGDTYASVATGVSAVFNADTNLQSIGLSSSAASQTVSATPTFPTYTGSTSGGATETLASGQTYEGQGSIAVGGTATTGDVLSIVVHYPGLTGLQETVSYTVLASDTRASIATGLAAALNADTHLQAIDLTSSTVSPTALTSAKTFSSNPTLPQGSSSLIVSAVDGGSNTKSNSYQIYTKGSPSQALVYDRNGNLISDGTNSYLWDAENRLIQINYPGSLNYGQFTYDGMSRIVKIIEFLGGTTTSTRQFVWSHPKADKDEIKETRDGTGVVLNQYFGYGQSVSGTASFFCTRDHLASVRELTNSSGNVQSQYAYTPYGQVLRLLNGVSSDYQFAGYYAHVPSGLNLAVHRSYNPSFGRWISRDPISEDVNSPNLYSYASNIPTGLRDPSGLSPGSETEGGGGDTYGTLNGIVLMGPPQGTVGTPLCTPTAGINPNPGLPKTGKNNPYNDEASEACSGNGLSTADYKKCVCDYLDAQYNFFKDGESKKLIRQAQKAAGCVPCRQSPNR